MVGHRGKPKTRPRGGDERKWAARRDAVLAKVEPSGGTVRVPRMDLAGVGSFAKLADPSGARFALMQP